MIKNNVPNHSPLPPTQNIDHSPDVSARNLEIVKIPSQSNAQSPIIDPAQEDQNQSNRSLQDNEKKYYITKQVQKIYGLARENSNSSKFRWVISTFKSEEKECTHDERMNKAVRHFKDAIYLREPRTDVDVYKNLKILKIYEFFTNPKWHYFMIILTVLFISQVFFEPANSQDVQSPLPYEALQYLAGQESIILFCYMIDTLASILEKPQPKNQIRQKQKFKHLKIIIGKIHWKFIIKFSFFFLNAIDFGYFFYQYPNSGLVQNNLLKRFSRIIRPFWIAFYSNEVKDTLLSLFIAFKNIFDIIAFYIILALFWAYLGYNLLSDVSDFYFHNYFYSFISIFSSYSMDSYPDMMIDAVNSSYLYLLYFIPFFSLNLWFLMPLPTAIVFHSYKSARANLVINNRLLVQEALIYCFICLDELNKGYLDYSEFLEFFSKVYNGRHIEKNIERMWKGMDIDGNNQMQIEEFVDILYILEYWPRVYERSSEHWDAFRNTLLHYLKIDKIVHSTQYLYAIITVVIANTICVVLYAVTDPNNSTQLDNLATMDTVFNSIYITDCILKMIGYGLENFFNDPWCKFDFVMFFVTIVSMIGIEYLHFMKKAKSSKILKIVKIEKVLRILRSVRGVKLFIYLEYGANKIRKIKILFQKISITFPIAIRLLLSMFLFFYFYSIIGMEVFNTNTNTYNQNSPFSKQDYANFNSFSASMLVLFSVCTQSNWINQMWNLGYQFDIYSSFFFFCSFYLISVFFLFSLLKGLIWEGFYIVDQTYDENIEAIEKQEEENDHHDHQEIHKSSHLLKQKQFGKILDKYKLNKYALSHSNSHELRLVRNWSIEQENKTNSFHFPYQTIITKIQSKKHQAVKNMKKIQKAFRKSIKAFHSSRSKQKSIVCSENTEELIQKKRDLLQKQFKKKIILFHEQVPRDVFIKVQQVPVKYAEDAHQTFDVIGLSAYCFNEKGVTFHTDRIKESINQISETSIKSKQKIETNQKKKQQMIDVGALNSQGQLMEKTVLKDFDQSTFDNMKSTYMNELYGAQKKFFISIAAMNLSNLELMRIKHCLRYKEISNNFVMKQIYKFEKNISRTVIKGLGGIRFLYEINDEWYYIEKQESNYTLHHIRQTGIWEFYHILFPLESLIYKADNILNLQANEDDEDLSLLDQVYQKFSSQLVNIFQVFKPYLIEEMFVDEEHLLLMSRVENHKGEELIEDALMNLKLNNQIKEGETIHLTEMVKSIITIGLYEIPKETRSIHTHTMRKPTHIQLLDEIKEKKEDLHDLEKEEDFSISLFAFLEFFKDVRDVIYNYQSNMFYNLQLLRYQNKKDQPE